MELQKFISQSLVEIMRGVKDAQAGAQECGGAVNPSRIRHEEQMKEVGFDHLVQPVDFDIAVEIRDEKKQGGNAKIEIIGVGVGLGGEKASQVGSTSASRMKFRVFCVYPVQPMTVKQKK